MSDRRSLADGVKPAPATDSKPPHAPSNGLSPAERAFAYGTNAPKAGDADGRTLVSTRIRSDLAKALKRASLQRQLDGITPNTLQDILEQALEPWLRSNGYLP